MLIEDGSDLVAELWSTEHRAVSSILTYAEGRAALAAARRAGRLTAGAARRVKDDFEAAYSELLLVAVDEALARHAGRLADDLALRGYDAVHLASALALGAGTTLVTWDRVLGQAALQRGCGVAPALSPPT